MKLHARLITLLVSFILFISVICFHQALKIRYRKAFGLLPSRLVIFGDEWSGILPPETLRKRDKTSAPAHVWTELLCSHIHADCSSFAPANTQEITRIQKGEYGAAVDNLIFDRNSTVPDLRTQVAAWIEAEQKAIADGKSQERSSLFSVFFGVNDVWKYSSYSRADGVAAVDASLDSMFEQLGVVGANWPDPIQVLMPYVLDITMLPGWKRFRERKDFRQEQLKNAVLLTRKWNHGLDLRARNWKKGRVLLWDMNKWFLDAIRNEAKDGWFEVKEGCAKNKKNICDRPDEFLMWDDIHLGPRAHEKIAQAVVQYLL
ncbi:hypothetical protein DFP73DRAFT_533328 [Morchella snyderi]|nr:hypothetical protein DFP73DRAFT_533328 [Morchella snyderi]